MRKSKAPHGPITEMLRACDGTTRFHMPGHKGRLDPYDVTELARTDDLYAPTGAIAQAEQLAAAACGAAHTLMLTGGSTAGLLAMLLSSVPPGAKLLAPRNAHHAVLSACVWGDIDVVFYAEGDAVAALAAHPDARAVLATRPDYYGRCPDLTPVIEKAHAQGAYVLVDEAHGAHFPWWDAPQSAGALGADAWVQSAHKTLPALTGAAFLHLSARMDAGRARRFLRMVQTSSPSFPILQSLDEARVWMDAYGRQALETLCGQLETLRGRIAGQSGYSVLPADDPTRLVIGTRQRGYTGFAVQEALATHGIDVEMADDACVVCICTVADTQHSLDRLLAGLRSIPQQAPLPPPEGPARPLPGERVASVRAAALSPQDLAPLSEAAGRVAAVCAGMYPPGTPYVLAGETVTPACAQALADLAPGRRFGVEDGYLACMR